MVASTAEDAATIHHDSAKLGEDAEEYAVHHPRTACHSPAKAEAEAHAEKEEEEEDRAGRNAVVVEDVDADDAADAAGIDDARRGVVAEDSSSSFHHTAAVVAGTGSGKRVGSPVRHRASDDDTDAVIRASDYYCGEVAVVVGNGAADAVWRVVGASLRRLFSGRTPLLNLQ